MLYISLILPSMDDIEDESVTRRGAAVARNIFGAAHTMNSANYVYFKAMSLLTALDSSNATSVCIDELLNLHRGQGMDLYWRENLSCPSDCEYIDMICNKTAGLFRMAARLLQGEGSADL
jgi:geranylgeranyl diphosphate synthase type 3